MGGEVLPSRQVLVVLVLGLLLCLVTLVRYATMGPNSGLNDGGTGSGGEVTIDGSNGGYVDGGEKVARRVGVVRRPRVRRRTDLTSTGGTLFLLWG